MARFDRAIQTALKLIKKNGEDTQMTVYTQQVDDPTKPWNGGEPTERALTARMVFLNFTEQSTSTNAGERYFEGSLIQQGDKKVLLAAAGLAFDPQLNAELKRKDGTVWKIVQMKLLDPNEQKILWTLQVRR